MMAYDDIIYGIKFLYDNTYCIFNDKVYKQLDGTPMGSAISSLLADIVMDDLESDCLQKLGFSPLFYFRYVDDIILCIPENKVDFTLETFNSYHNKLQFTIENEKDNRINFLDTIIIKDNNNIITTDWYQKSTFSGRILHFNSNHPKHQKIAMIYNLIDRALILSDKKFHHKNMSIVNQILSSNNYPQIFIKKYASRRISILKNCNFNLNNRNYGENNNKSINYKDKIIVKVPYKCGLYSNVKRILNNNTFFVIPKIKKELVKIVRKGKMDNKLNKTGVIYKIKCNDCECVYIGETKRSLYMRIKEHQYYVKKNKKTSVLATHSNKCNHTFNFENVEVIDEEPNWHMRITSEMLHIHLQDAPLNCKEDTENLHSSYMYVLNTLK